MEMIEVEMSLTRNPKCGRGWLAAADLDSEELEFLRPVEGSIDGKAIFLLEDGKFYITKDDYSSWKNSRQCYTIYYADPEKQELIEIASIDYVNSRKTLSAIDDETKEVLKKAYNRATNGKKTIHALCTAAKFWAVENNITQPRQDEELINSLKELIGRYGYETVESVLATLRR